MKYKAGVRVRVVREGDPLGRWQKGEEGITLKNDYAEKYDAFVRLPNVPAEGGRMVPRFMYFYSDEITPIR